MWRFVVVPAYPDHAVPRIKYNQTCFVFCKLLRLRNSARDFFLWGRGGGVIFGLGIFWGCLFLPPFNQPRHLKFGIPSLGTAQTWFLHNFSQSTRVNRKQIRWVFVATITHMSRSTCVAGRIVFAQSSKRRMHGFQNVSSPFFARPSSSSTKTLFALTIPLRVTQIMFHANNSALENKLLPCQRTPWFHNQFFPVWLDQHTTKN